MNHLFHSLRGSKREMLLHHQKQSLITEFDMNFLLPSQNLFKFPMDRSSATPLGIALHRTPKLKKFSGFFICFAIW